MQRVGPFDGDQTRVGNLSDHDGLRDDPFSPSDDGNGVADVKHDDLKSEDGLDDGLQFVGLGRVEVGVVVVFWQNGIGLGKRRDGVDPGIGAAFKGEAQMEWLVVEVLEVLKLELDQLLRQILLQGEGNLGSIEQ